MSIAKFNAQCRNVPPLFLLRFQMTIIKRQLPPGHQCLRWGPTLITIIQTPYATHSKTGSTHGPTSSHLRAATKGACRGAKLPPWVQQAQRPTTTRISSGLIPARADYRRLSLGASRVPQTYRRGRKEGAVLGTLRGAYLALRNRFP